jgi:hypothetical protein
MGPIQWLQRQLTELGTICNFTTRYPVRLREQVGKFESDYSELVTRNYLIGKIFGMNFGHFLKLHQLRKFVTNHVWHQPFPDV